MSVLAVRLVIVLLVTVEGVNGGRRFVGDRRRYYHQPKPVSFRTQLRSLNSQLDLCFGKFLCGVRTVDNQCQLECIDDDNVCDGTINCDNGRDEMTCSGRQNVTPCPTIQPCPEETPCPSSECPTGEIRCGDGSACKAIQDICDGTDQCPPGDTVDKNILQCNAGRCVEGAEPDICVNTYSDPTGFIDIFSSGVSDDTCRMLCQLNEECADTLLTWLEQWSRVAYLAYFQQLKEFRVTTLQLHLSYIIVLHRSYWLM